MTCGLVPESSGTYVTQDPTYDNRWSVSAPVNGWRGNRWQLTGNVSPNSTGNLRVTVEVTSISATRTVKLMSSNGGPSNTGVSPDITPSWTGNTSGTSVGAPATIVLTGTLVTYATVEGGYFTITSGFGLHDMEAKITKVEWVDTTYGTTTICVESDFDPPPPTCFITFSERESIASRYFCTLEDHEENRVAIFDDWRSLEYTKKVNDVGSLRFVIDGRDERAALFDLDYIFKVYRSVPGVGLDWYVDFVGLHRSSFWKTFQNGNIQYSSFGVSPNDLIRRRAIAYRSGDTQAEADAVGETAMKQFVYDNMGGGASSAIRRFVNILGEGTYPFGGQLAGLSIEADGGAGANFAGARAYDNLLEVLQDIANKTGVDFEMVRQSGNIWYFKTYANQLGSDRTTDGLDATTGLNSAGNAPIIFSVENGNVSEISYSLSRLEEANAVVAMGKGERSTRTVVALTDDDAIDDSPWNRIEITRNGSSNDYVAQLEDFARKWLFDMQSKEEFKFTPLQQPDYLYGQNYFLGDKVTATYSLPDGTFIERDKRILSVSVTVSGDTRLEEVSMKFADVI